MDPRKYYVEECYALDNCLHCADCLAFALKFMRESTTDETKKRNLVLKFVLSTIAAENIPCEKALPADDLRQYVNELIDGTQELPICHYEFR